MVHLNYFFLAPPLAKIASVSVACVTSIHSCTNKNHPQMDEEEKEIRKKIKFLSVKIN